MGYDTAVVVTEEAGRCVARRRPMDDSLRRVITVLSRHVRAAPPAAVGRSVAEFRRRDDKLPGGRPVISDGFEMIFRAAIEHGELGGQMGAREVAEITQAVVMESLIDWVRDQVNLTKTLERRTNLLLDGVRGS